MPKRCIQPKNTKQRTFCGSIIAEHAVTLYVLFLFLFFPMLDLGTIGIRMFFLWFACNQAAMAGAKGGKWSAGNVGSTTNYANSIQTQAKAAAASIVGSFSGITLSAGYPQLNVVLRGIQHSDSTANQPSASTVTYLNGAGLPLATPVDISQYVPILQVEIVGTVQPFITVPFLNNIPGLSAPFTVTIFTEQQIEDAQALSS